MRVGLLGVALLAAMVLTALLAWRGSRIAAAAVLLLAGAWLLADKDFEGPHIVAFVPSHGLVVADLVGIAAVVVAVVAWIRTGRRRAMWSRR
jgi:hypothetical protein